MADAILHLDQIICDHESSGGGSDDVYLGLSVDNSDFTYPWPGKGHVDMDTGTKKYADVNLKVSFNSSIKIQLWDADAARDDLLGEFNIQRVHDLEPEGELTDPGAPRDKAIYRIKYRLIMNPMPTLRVHGIRCQKASLGIEMGTVNTICDAAGDCADAASTVIGEIKRPEAEIISLAFDAASAILSALPNLIEFFAKLSNNPDDVFMIRRDAAKAAEGGFFPPGEQKYYEMRDGDEVRFEKKYGEYFRFPLDRGPVAIQIREYDPIKKNISLGSVQVDPDTTNLMNGPAQVITASELYENEGDAEGAVYHLCYSVGMDDWSKPAKKEIQDANWEQ